LFFEIALRQRATGADATVLDAVAKMADKDVGSLVMMDGEKLVGNGAFYSPIAYPKTAVV